ncbi:MAG TPA: hypothetical protein DCM05_08065 [Elusimicrobia bacterium]|nr:hypothetical protein [Elusimicrobiota bacterium]
MMMMGLAVEPDPASAYIRPASWALLAMFAAAAFLPPLFSASAWLRGRRASGRSTSALAYPTSVLLWNLLILGVLAFVGGLYRQAYRQRGGWTARLLLAARERPGPDKPAAGEVKDEPAGAEAPSEEAASADERELLREDGAWRERAYPNSGFKGPQAMPIPPMPAPPGGGFCGLVCASQIMTALGLDCDRFDDERDWKDSSGGRGFYDRLGVGRCSPKDVGQWLCDESKKCPRECQCRRGEGSPRRFDEEASCRVLSMKGSLSEDDFCRPAPSSAGCSALGKVCGAQTRCPGDDANCSTETWQPALQAFFEAHGLRTESARTLFDEKTGLVPDDRFEGLMRHVRSGRPVIVHVKGHYLLVVGHDDRKTELTFTDSRVAKAGTVAYADFRRTDSPWWARWKGCGPACREDMDAWDGRFLAVWR